MSRIIKHYEEIERMRQHLTSKISTVEQMELENLETHLILDQRFRQLDLNSPLESSLSGRNKKSTDIQTDLSWKALLEQEKTLEIK